MAETHDDYVWDHAGEDLETASLLQGSARQGNSLFYNFCRQDSGSQKLNKRQAEYLLHSLEDGAAMIRTHLLEINTTAAETVPQTRPNCCQPCKKCLSFMERFSLISTFILQVVNIVIISLIDHLKPKEQKDPAIAAGEIVMIVIELLNVLLVMYASYRLAQQMIHKRVNNCFLAQCYVSSILIFSGIYTLTYRIEQKSWKFISDDDGKTIVEIIFLYLRMMYLSVSTATLCGSSVIIPKGWYNYLFLGLQMILSFVAFTSILSQMFANSGAHTPRPLKPAIANRRPSIDSQTSHGAPGSYGAFDNTSINRPRNDDR